MSAPSHDPHGADPLSDVLGALQLRNSAVTIFHLGAPWGMDVPRFGPAFIYAVIEGEGVVEVEGEAPLRFEAGDLFLSPRGDRCILRSAPGVPTAFITEVFEPGTELWTPARRLDAPLIAHYGGGGPQTLLLVLLLDFAESDPNPLGLNLPRLIHLKREDNHMTPWLTPAAQSVVDEAKLGRLGYFAMVTRLAELLFINAIRTHLILRPEAASGWLRGLSDPRIARVLSVLHRRPEQRWTVEAMAAEAGMSRSAFAEKFQRLIGETPFDYVTRWRMGLARDWIAAGRRSVKAAAHDLGYASEKAFSQAFRRTMGATPSSFRPARTG